MKSPELNLERWPDGAPPQMPNEEALNEEALDTASLEADAHASDASTAEAYRPSLWDALVGYWGYGEPEPSMLPEPSGRWLLDEDDFSSEHGYQAGFEGRSEFEHGEFDLWL